MITPQDIREKSFEKAVFGGYDMSAVDDFLEECANDLTLLQKENTTLRGKMKVLVDKVEEYRANEATLNEAIISAHKLGKTIESEAVAKRDAMLDDAQEQADILIGQAQDQADEMVRLAQERAETLVRQAQEEADRILHQAQDQYELEQIRLTQAQNSSIQFIDNMHLLCSKHMDFLTRLNDIEFVREARDQVTARESAEIPATQGSPTVFVPPTPEQAPAPAPAPEQVPEQAQAPAPEPEQNPIESQVYEPEDYASPYAGEQGDALQDPDGLYQNYNGEYNGNYAYAPASPEPEANLNGGDADTARPVIAAAPAAPILPGVSVPTGQSNMAEEIHDAVRNIEMIEKNVARAAGQVDSQIQPDVASVHNNYKNNNNYDESDDEEQSTRAYEIISTTADSDMGEDVSSGYILDALS